MDRVLFARYLTVMLLLIPTVLYMYLPVKDHLKWDLKDTLMIVSGVIACLIVSLSFFGMFTGIHWKWVYFIGALPLFPLFSFSVNFNLRGKVFCYFDSLMVVTSAMLYGAILAAPMEVGNPAQVLLEKSSVVLICVATFLGIIYYRTLTVKISYLLKMYPIGINLKNAIAVTVGLTALFLYVIPHSAEVVMTGRTRIATLLFLVLAPLTYLLMFNAFYRIAKNLTETEQLRKDHDLMEMERKRYDELRSYMEDTKKQRHDFRQHLLVIDEYARNGETEKLLDYTKQFSNILNEKHRSYAPNPAVDAVVSHYADMADEQGTKVEWKIILPEELPIPESDFITIFGNLVENALIAVRKLPDEERYVNVSATMLSDAMLGITVKNPYAGKIKLGKNGLPKTSKSGHGIGLTSVDTIVRRYNGALDINTDDDLFSVGILLYL